MKVKTLIRINQEVILVN